MGSKNGIILVAKLLRVKAKDTKKNKERVTILLCCNATGTKKNNLLVIGKYQNPCCVKKINTQTMEKWNE